MPDLDQKTFNDIMNLLIPHCADPASRKGLAERALFGCSVLDSLDYSGNPRDYVAHFVTTLLTYGDCQKGQPSIVAVLEQVKTQVGITQQEAIDKLIVRVPGGVVETPLEGWQIQTPTSAKYVFISYSRENLADVRHITTDLLSGGVNVWIDQADLKAGTADWEQALRDAIDGAYAVLFMASPAARRSAYVRDELAIAQAKNKVLFPVWVDGEERTDCIPMGLGYVQLVDVRGDAYATGLQHLVDSLSTSEVDDPSLSLAEVDTSKPVRNPYKGLRPFRAEDAEDFFGRDTLIEELIDTLGTGTTPPRLLAVLGASGSGKSSVIMAGLLPRLRNGEIADSSDWLYLNPIVPGTHPIENLMIALRKYLSATSQTAIREDLMNRNKRGLHTLTRELSDKPVVLYIDQFEELFTLVNDEAERRQFIDLLTTAITEPNGVLIVILSMRADFYDRPAEYKEFGDLIRENHVLITPMSLADLYDVVQKPASQNGLVFDDGLATEIVFDVREEAGALPLLQFTLDQLYEERDGHRLTKAAYEVMGGVEGALAQHAEATYQKLESDKHKQLARSLFLRLIEAGVTEQDTTRRRATASELTLPEAEDTRILKAVADKFVDVRLLVSDQTGAERTLEVSHEALIREWQRLGDWLHDAREDLRLQRSLSADVAEWKRRGEPDDMLYRGTVLSDAQTWAKRNNASRDETRFLNASQANQTERQQREARTDRNLRYAFGGLIAVIVIASIGLALIFARNNADLQAEAEALQAIALTSEYQSNYAQAQVDFAATRQFGISPYDITQTPAADFAATATAYAEYEWEIVSEEFNGVEMVLVPTGCFFMGGNEYEYEQPIHEVCFDAAFWIDRYEVSNQQFEDLGGEAADAGAWSEPLQPRTAVTWYEARDFCEDKRGGRLPTDAEWEYAVRGPHSLVYAWGNEFDGENVVYNGNADFAAEVGSREGGVSWVGAYDMNGNVLEWVNTIYDQEVFPYPYATDDGRENAETGDNRVVRGGSFANSPYNMRSAYRNGSASDYANFYYGGFRCARDN